MDLNTTKDYNPGCNAWAVQESHCSRIKSWKKTAGGLSVAVGDKCAALLSLCVLLTTSVKDGESYRLTSEHWHWVS